MLTRRAFTSTLAAGTSTLAMPATLRASGRPTTGVRFVTSDAPDAETLSVQYNLAYQLIPRLRALCSDAESVAATIRWAREEGLSFALRSGGHCYTGSSAHPDLVIDLRQMDRISINPVDHLLTAQPGVKLAAVYRAGFPHDMTVPAGWCGDVGVGGHALGGGMGFLTRAHGALCDHLIGLTLVDANGQLREVDEVRDPDLLWASRGGGGGLGVVTQYRFAMERTHSITALRVFGSVSLSQTAPLIHRWMTWSLEQPDHTTSHLAVMVLSDGRPFIRITGMSGWSTNQLETSLAPVHQGLLPIGELSFLEGGYSDVMEETVLSLPFLFAASDSRSAFRPAVVSLSELEALIQLQQRAQNDGHSLTFGFETLGGRLNAIEPQATAFPHRRSAFLSVATTSAFDRSGLAEAEPYLDDAATLLRSGANGLGYANYRDRSLADYPVAYWDENVPKLQAIKRRVDPDGLFSSLHTVPL